MILTIVGELKRLTIVLIAQKADDLLEGILRGARDAKFIGLNGDLDLELLALDVLIDLLGSRLVDSLDGYGRGDGRSHRKPPGDHPT